jgi:hypothetical protein
LITGINEAGCPAAAAGFGADVFGDGAFVEEAFVEVWARFRMFMARSSADMDIRHA